VPESALQTVREVDEPLGLLPMLQSHGAFYLPGCRSIDRRVAVRVGRVRGRSSIARSDFTCIYHKVGDGSPFWSVAWVGGCRWWMGMDQGCDTHSSAEEGWVFE
jgi:hypothetical protein